MKKRAKAKRKPRPTRKPSPAKRLVLQPGLVAQVFIPKGTRPVVIPDPVKNVVEIVPVKISPRKSWWGGLFGS